MRSRLSTREWILLSAAALLLSAVSAQSIGIIGNRSAPTVSSPGGFPLFVIGFLFQSPFPPIVIAGTAFFLMEWKLMTRQRVAAKWGALVVVVVGALSSWYFVSSWKWGVEYEDRQYGNPHYTVTTAILSATFGAILLLLLYCTRRVKSAWSQLLVHFVFAAWIVTYAFPYLGETPALAARFRAARRGRRAAAWSSPAWSRSERSSARWLRGTFPARPARSASQRIHVWTARSWRLTKVGERIGHDPCGENKVHE